MDVAIWSTIEQDLAISAGSLATMRPFFHLVLCKLSITTCSETRPSNYGASHFSSQIIGNSRRLSRTSDLDTFKLSSTVGAQTTIDSKQGEVDAALRPPSQHSSNPERFKSSRGTKSKKSRVTEDNESQKSLNDISKKISNDSLDPDAMQIFVKTFLVTGEWEPSSMYEGRIDK